MKGSAQKHINCMTLMAERIKQRKLYEIATFEQRLMIDCSHANSEKDPMRQIDVSADIGHQIAGGDNHIFGVMVESHLKAGRQDITPGKKPVLVMFGSKETMMLKLYGDIDQYLSMLSRQ
jgi:3-deoxy-7-phosphoheptulonate synthase